MDAGPGVGQAAGDVRACVGERHRQGVGWPRLPEVCYNDSYSAPSVRVCVNCRSCHEVGRGGGGFQEITAAHRGEMLCGRGSIVQ